MAGWPGVPSRGANTVQVNSNLEADDGAPSPALVSKDHGCTSARYGYRSDLFFCCASDTDTTDLRFLPPGAYRTSPPASPVSHITMSGRGSRVSCGSRSGRRSGISKSVARSRGRGRVTSQTTTLPNQTGTTLTPTPTESVNLVALGFPIDTRVYTDPYVITSNSENTARVGQFGLLPSGFRLGLLQVTSRPVPVSEPYGHQFDHLDFSLYSSSRRCDSHHLMSIPHNPPKRDK